MVVMQAEGTVENALINPDVIKATDGLSDEEKLASVGIDVAKAVGEAKIEATAQAVSVIEDPQYVIDMLVKKHNLTEEQAKEYLANRNSERAAQIEAAKEGFVTQMMEKENCTREEAELRFRHIYAELYMDPVDSFVFKQMSGLHSFFQQVTDAMNELEYNRGRRHEELLHIALHSSFKSKELADVFQRRVRLYLEDSWAAMGALTEVFKKSKEKQEVAEKEVEKSE